MKTTLLLAAVLAFAPLRAIAKDQKAEEAPENAAFEERRTKWEKQAYAEYPELKDLNSPLRKEAHRLSEKSGLYGNLGDHQVEELIHSTRCAVFFIDEDQGIRQIIDGRSQPVVTRPTNNLNHRVRGGRSYRPCVGARRRPRAAPAQPVHLKTPQIHTSGSLVTRYAAINRLEPLTRYVHRELCMNSCSGFLA